MTTLETLLERVCAATGPDRELDWDIQQPIFGIEKTDFHGTPRYTASIDAALALVERVLPDAEMHLTLNHPMHEWQTASIRVAPLKLLSGEEATMPLAIIAACLSALIQGKQS